MTVIEMFETMAEIEGVCGRLAAQRATPASLVDLQATNDLCMRAIEDKDADAYSRHNETFHQKVYKMCGNGFLETEALRLYRRLKPFRRVQFHMHERMEQSVAEHAAILSALSERNSEKTAEIMRTHVGMQGERFYNQMAQLRRTVANRNTA